MIDTDKGRAEISRFAVDLAIRIALIAGVVWVSLVLLRPIMPLMAWAVILAVAVHPAFAILRRRLDCTAVWRRPSFRSSCSRSCSCLSSCWRSRRSTRSKAMSKLLAEGGHLVPSPPESIREWPLIGQRLHDLWSQRHRGCASAADGACRADRIGRPIDRPARRRRDPRDPAVRRRHHRRRRAARLRRDADRRGARPCRSRRRRPRSPLPRHHRLDHPQRLAGRHRHRAPAVRPAGHRHAGGGRALRRRPHLRLPACWRSCRSGPTS